jgi:hypothetical protein
MQRAMSVIDQWFERNPAAGYPQAALERKRGAA